MQPTHETEKTNTSAKTKRNKLATSSFISGLLSPLTLFITLLPAVILGIIALANIRRHGLTGTKRAVFGIVFPIIALIALAGLWAWDMPPIENDYTVADLRSAPPECEPSYEILLELLEYTNEAVPYKETPEEKEKREKSGKETQKLLQKISDEIKIDGFNKDTLESLFEKSPKTRTRYVCSGLGLDGNDDDILESISDKIHDVSTMDDQLRVVNENRADIEQLWQNCEKGRKLIQKLDAFPEIADLTEASPIDSLNTLGLKNLKQYYQILNYHCIILCESNNSEQAARDLRLFDSVISKIERNSRYIVDSLTCTACISGNLDIASTIATHPNCKANTIEILKQHFSQKHLISFENALIFEYLMQKASVEQLTQHPIPFLLKKNSTLRLFRNYADACLKWYGYRDYSKDDLHDICRFLTVQFFPDLDEESFSRKIYSVYNPVGFKTVLIMTPAFGKTKHIADKANRKIQLLQCLLAGDFKDTPERRLVIFEDESKLYADYVQNDHEISCRCRDCFHNRISLSVCDDWIAKHKDTIGVIEISETEN